MARSFEIVEKKVAEADFFLEKFSIAGQVEKGYYLNAFLSASRSITFCLQASLRDLSGFNEWYETKQKVLRESQLAKFFKDARDLSQKVGYDITTSADYQYHMASSDSLASLFIEGMYKNGLLGKIQEDFPKGDFVSFCKAYMRILMEILWDCHDTFGSHIDPAEYYTIENITKIGLSIEDIEVRFGFPAGWTKCEDIDDAKRLELLTRDILLTEINIYFHKYLGKTRRS